MYRACIYEVRPFYPSEEEVRSEIARYADQYGVPRPDVEITTEPGVMTIRAAGEVPNNYRGPLVWESSDDQRMQQILSSAIDDLVLVSVNRWYMEDYQGAENITIRPGEETSDPRYTVTYPGKSPVGV